VAKGRPEFETANKHLFVYLFVYLFINPHQDNVTTKTQLETSKTTVWNKWLTQGNASYV